VFVVHAVVSWPEIPPAFFERVFSAGHHTVCIKSTSVSPPVAPLTRPRALLRSVSGATTLRPVPTPGPATSADRPSALRALAAAAPGPLLLLRRWGRPVTTARNVSSVRPPTMHIYRAAEPNNRPVVAGATTPRAVQGYAPRAASVTAHRALAVPAKQEVREARTRIHCGQTASQRAARPSQLVLIHGSRQGFSVCQE